MLMSITPILIDSLTGQRNSPKRSRLAIIDSDQDEEAETWDYYTSFRLVHCLLGKIYTQEWEALREND